jgi:MYND finger
MAWYLHQCVQFPQRRENAMFIQNTTRKFRCCLRLGCMVNSLSHPATAFLMCSKCDTIGLICAYCSRDCQLQDWTGRHKLLHAALPFTSEEDNGDAGPYHSIKVGPPEDTAHAVYVQSKMDSLHRAIDGLMREHGFENPPDPKCLLLHILDGGYIPAADGYSIRLQMTDVADSDVPGRPIVFEVAHSVGVGMVLQALSHETKLEADHTNVGDYRGPVENGHTWHTLPSMLGGRNHLSDQDARNCLFPKLRRFIRALLQVVYEDPQHVAHNSRSIRLEDEVFRWKHVPGGAGDRWMAHSTFATGLPYDHIWVTMRGHSGGRDYRVEFAHSREWRLFRYRTEHLRGVLAAAASEATT